MDQPKTKPNTNSGAVWTYGGEEKRAFAPNDYVFGRTLSTACIVDDIIYIPELAGFVHCLDARTGKCYWRYDLRSVIWSSVMYADGKVFVGNEDGDVFVFRHEAHPQTIDAVEIASKQKDAKTAKLAYRAAQKQIKETYLVNKIEMNACIRSTPTVAAGRLWIATESMLYCIGEQK